MRAQGKVDWVAIQAESTADIICSPYVDWFHGGLQFQITHHLFPRLPSFRLREATPEVYAMLRAHKCPVHEYDGIAGGVAAVTRQLATACEAAGHLPWPLKIPETAAKDKASGGWALQAPLVFWGIVHVFLFVALPLLRCPSGLYCTIFVAIFSLFVFPAGSPRNRSCCRGVTKERRHEAPQLVTAGG